VLPPQDLLDAVGLLNEEAPWTKAVTTPGSQLVCDGWARAKYPSCFVGIGTVLEGAKDPVNGRGRDGMVFVECVYEGQKAQRFYPAYWLKQAVTEVNRKAN